MGYPFFGGRGGFLSGFGSVTATSLSATTVTATSLVGTLTGDSTGTHTGGVNITDAADGLKIGGSTGKAIQAPPPDTNAEFEAMTGLTSAAWWRFDRLNSGNAASLGDTAGTLVAAGTPTFNAHCGPRTGVHYDASTGDAHSADVLDAALSSFICGGRFALLTDPGGTSHQLIGRMNATVANGWTISVDDSGNLFYFFDDGDASSFSGFPAGLNALMTIAGQHVDLVIQLDRSGAAPELRIRASRHGVSIGTGAVTLTDCGTLTGASQEFGFGAIPAGSPVYNGGAWCQWAFYASGAQAEGATKAQTVSQGLGFE
jgi:hypothetical protein